MEKYKIEYLTTNKEFKGKLINKITQAEKHTDKVIAASLTNVDIAGLDVGPPMDAHTTLQTYKEAFNSYQYYATLAAKAGVPWMNGEYWQGDFDNGYSDFATFSLPQGETTQKALTDFLSKI